MHRILFSIGSYPIYSYGVLVALGCIAGAYYAAFQSWRLGIKRDDAFEASVWVIAMAVIGARIGFVIQNLPFYFTHPVQILNFRAGGMSWHGSIFGILFGVWVPTRRMGIHMVDYLDLLAPGMMLGLAIGRIGCFLNGCCYGKIAPPPWGIVTPTEDNPNVALSRYPTQLYEMTLAFIAFGFLSRALGKRKFRGQIYCEFLITYSIIRFVVEFWRAGSVLPGGLTLAQYVSIAIVILGVVLMGVGRKRAARAAQEAKQDPVSSNSDDSATRREVVPA